MASPNFAEKAELAAQFALVHECRAVRPDMAREVASDSVGVEGLALAVGKPLRVLATAAAALAHDMSAFVLNGLAENEGTAAAYFVRAAFYYANSLIISPFHQIEKMLSDRNAAETRPALRKQLDETAEAVDSVRRHLDNLDEAIGKAGWTLSMASLVAATLVPSASPYQLLFEALFEREATSGRLLSKDDHTLLLSLQHKQLFSLVANPSPVELTKKPSRKIGDGRPTMVFASVYRGNNTERHILFGCNTPNWRGFNAVWAIAKAFRDRRLQAYIPWGDSALRALHDLEISFLSEIPDERKKELLVDARKKAKKAMESHRTFLGGTHESGLALRTPDWTGNMPCYLCSSMMGYMAIKTWTETEQTGYFLTFN